MLGKGIQRKSLCQDKQSSDAVMSWAFTCVQVQHLKGDRMDFEFVKTSLAAKGFDVVYDINGNCFNLA